MSKQPKPKTKSRLLSASIQEFAAHGYRGASLRDIARLADTNVSAVTYHYDSKDALWQAAVSHLYQTLEEALDTEKLDSSISNHDIVRNSTRNHIKFSAFLAKG